MDTILSTLMNSEIDEEDFVCKCGHDTWGKEVFIRDGKALITYTCFMCRTNYYLALKESPIISD
jgi:hypothetical protein